MTTKLLLLSVLTLTLVSCTPPSPKPSSKVSATGHATIDVKPDIATIRFQILVFNKDAAAATKDLALTSLKLVTYFSQQKIDEKDIEAHEIEKNIIRNTDDRGKPLEIQGYEITRTFSVKLKDLDKFESTMRELYAMPYVSQLGANFESKEKEKQEAELLQKACADAKNQAEELAKGFNVSLGRVYRISNAPINELFDFAEINTKGMSIGVESLGAGSSSEPLFYPPATIQLSQEIYAVYELNN